MVGYYEPKVMCNICEREGHTQRSCDFAESRLGQNMSIADWYFWLHVDPSDRPEGFDED